MLIEKICSDLTKSHGDTFRGQKLRGRGIHSLYFDADENIVELLNCRAVEPTLVYKEKCKNSKRNLKYVDL